MRVRVVIHPGWPKAGKWLWVQVIRAYPDATFESPSTNPLEEEFLTWASLENHVASPGKIRQLNAVAVLHQALNHYENADGREHRLFERALREIGERGTVEHWFYTPGIDGSKVAWRFIHRPKPERDGGSNVTCHLVKGEHGGQDTGHHATEISPTKRGAGEGRSTTKKGGAAYGGTQ